MFCLPSAPLTRPSATLSPDHGGEGLSMRVPPEPGVYFENYCTREDEFRESFSPPQRGEGAEGG